MAKASALSNEYILDSESDSESGTIQNFKAPSDYKKCEHLKKFSLKKLTKKSEEQVWLINIPASLDISKLKTLPIDFKRTSSVVVDKQSYEIEQEKNKDNSNLVVLVPDDKRDSLEVLTKDDKPFEFDKIFTISESTDIPDIQYEKVRIPRENVPVVGGLITRHFATGYDANDFGITEEVSEKKKEHSKKRHHVHDDSEVAPSKKKKKDKKEKKSKKEKKKDHK